MSKEITYSWNLATAVKILLTLGRLYLGGWMLTSGTSYWLTQAGLPTIFPQPVGNTPLSSQMLVTMIEVGLFDIVKTLEIVCGLMLIFNRFVPLGLVIAMPISAVVWYNAIVLNGRYDRLFSPTYMGVMCFYLSIVLMLAYLRFYAPLLTWKAKMGGLGDVKELIKAAKTEA
ncbi:DoxX family protein (plasmid) [Neorhizobium sp. SOG26]|jgi:uncharacterized membrane protein YphA (DoxX/SURF4 family)|uniref:DoxX family protein n=1 Tax=Neorhizobium sp. SOG26 TaxID=2060726 RepID=UPI000E57DB5B|nr:DoxX family protein [Neorhizobium sp. SOG26]AXV17525.1 DoxX family protein [Neorhizobium sp. SOG26]